MNQWSTAFALTLNACTCLRDGDKYKNDGIYLHVSCANSLAMQLAVWFFVVFDKLFHNHYKGEVILYDKCALLGPQIKCVRGADDITFGSF